jgi:hypothetical protein
MNTYPGRPANADSRLDTGETKDWKFAGSVVAVLLGLEAGGLAGLNMQVVTGFNIQAPLHFPHMVLQPAGMILFAILISLASRRFHSSRLLS